MHPAFAEALASQRIAALRAAPVTRHRVAGQASTQPLRQRFGWVLVQVGLRLAVRQART